jgi:alpha-glucosidase (family GH31 glycosyl hydrolase)
VTAVPRTRILPWARPFVRPTTSTTTASARTTRDFSTIAAIQCVAGQDYDAPAAPSFCVPFLVTNKGYGLLWDNPSKTTIEPGFNEQTRWTSQVGDRVSFFVIAGATADEIYAGYRLLTGPTHMLPKAAYGYIQCKQRYASQKEVLDVARATATAICRLT